MAFTPVISSSPTAVQPPKAQSSGGSDYGILDETTYKELVHEGGLINDVNSFVKQLSDLQSSSSNPFLNSRNRSNALQLIGKINELKESKNMWNKALARVENQDALGEVAVGSSGEVYTKDKDNKLTAMSIGEYMKKKDSVRLLTNNELLYERQYNPQLVGNSGIINVASSAVGLNKITDHIKSLISAFGNEEISDTKVYSKNQVLTELGKYTGKKPTEEEAIAVKKLMDIANTPGELYKVKTENSSERRQAMKGAKYIWDTLGEPAQKKLAATAAMNGRTSPIEIILDMISVGTDVKENTEITPETTKNADGTSGKEKPISEFELFHSGKTGPKTFMLNDPTTSGNALQLVATGIKKLTNSKGELIKMGTLRSVLDQDVGNLLNTSKIFYGDKQLSEGGLDEVIYNPNAMSARVMMPTTSDGKPDYHKLEQFTKIQNEVTKRGLSNPQQIQELYASYGYNVQIDNNGNVMTSQNVKPFLVMYGYTTDEAKASQANGKIKEVERENKESIMGILSKAYKDAKVTNLVGNTAMFSSVYSGIIAIPYLEDSSLYGAAMGNNLLSNQADVQSARTMMQTQQNGRTILGSTQSLY